MATAINPGTRRTDAPSAAVDAAAAPVRAFLLAYLATLLPLLVALIALEVLWVQTGGGTWPTAAVVLTSWCLAVAACLRRRGWRTGPVATAVCTPAALLAGPVACGWASPAGLALWGPVGTLLAVALVMSARPGGGPAHDPARSPV